jgi:hypothetical protein
MSGVLGTQGYKTYFGQRTCATLCHHAQLIRTAKGYRQGGITASMPAGSLVGALMSSFIADKLSRRTAIQVSAVVWILGSMFVFCEQALHYPNRVQLPDCSEWRRPSLLRSRHRGHLCRYCFFNCSRVSGRDCTKGYSRSCSVFATMGHHLVRVTVCFIHQHRSHLCFVTISKGPH